MEREVLKLAYEIAEKVSYLFITQESTRKIYCEYFKDEKLCAEQLEEIIITAICRGHQTAEDTDGYYGTVLKLLQQTNDLSIRKMLE